jgi:signal transduction histidine kinase
VNFRLRIAAWFGISLTIMIGLMMVTAHWHLDEELREDRWDRTHPKYPNWVIHGSYTNEEVHDILGELMKTWLWVGTPAVAISLGVGFLLARRSVRPIRQINEQLNDLTPSTMRAGIVTPEEDPVLADLVTHINASLDRAGAAYDEMAGFSSRVAHELRTPLTLLRMKIEQSRGGMPGEMQEEFQEELARLSRFVERSLLAAKAASGSLELHASRVDVTKLLDDIAEGYNLLAEEQNLQFIYHATPGLEALTDADLLRQVLHNLLGNALRYAHSKVEVVATLDVCIPVVTILNDCDTRTMATDGLGLGLRLVRGICTSTGMDFKTQISPGGFIAMLHIDDFSRPESPGSHLSRRSPIHLSKHPVELRERLKAGFVGDFGDVFARVDEPRLGVLDADLSQILAESQTRGVMKHPG